MKNIVLLFLLQLLVTLTYAQAVDSVFEEPYFDESRAVYIRVGVNQAGTRGFGAEQSYLDNFAGLHLGIGISESLHYSDRIWLNGEVSYSQQGFKMKNVVESAEAEYLKLTYINVPVVLRYYPFPRIKNFYIGAGPQIGFCMEGHVQTKGGADFPLVYEEFAQVDFAGVGVTGIHFNHLANFGLEARYQLGMSKFLLDAPQGRHSVCQVSLFFPAEAVTRLVDVISSPFRGLYKYNPFFLL